MRLLPAAIALALALSACGPGPTQPLAPSIVSATAGITSEGCEATTERGVGVLLENGMVLTSAHVVAGTTIIQVTVEGREHEATVLADHWLGQFSQVMRTITGSCRSQALLRA